jgi:plastocyanin
MPAAGKNLRYGVPLLVASFAIFAVALFGIAQLLNEKPAAADDGGGGGGGNGGGGTVVAGQPVAVTVVAKDIQFQPRAIKAGVGVEVTVTLDNQDAGVLHNISFYTTPQASEVIFEGELFPGVATKEEVFTAPASAGNYFFRCDVHPDQMTGTFIVE